VFFHREQDPRTVARWLERDGRIDPNGSNARRLAKHFGRPEDYFLVDGVAETDGAAA
jgi:hypothetical protein